MNVTLDMILGREDILISWFVIILVPLGVALLFVGLCCMIRCERLRLSDVNKLSYLLTYLLKDGENDWQSMPATSDLKATITGLDEDSVYEIAVAVHYQGGQWGPASSPIRVETDRFANGKCFYRSMLRRALLCG